MAIVYRTAGAWGPGKGSDVLPAEVDNNFFELATRVLTLEENPPDPNSIDTITVVGGQMTITLTGGETFGPFTLPVALLVPRGDFANGVAYHSLDLVTDPTTGLYLVLQAHTGVAPFDPNRTIGGNAVYSRVTEPGPPGPQGIDGPIGPQGIFFIDASGPLSLRDAHDSEDPGFTYESTDGDGSTITTSVLYIMGDAGVADWTGPYKFEGDKGDTGDQGIGFQIDAIGDFAGRSAYDSQPGGFTYLSEDGDGPGGDYTTSVIFIHGPSVGSWNGPYPFAGPPGASFQPDAIGDFAGRAAHDAEAAGYTYLSTDGDAGATTTLASLFIKDSGTSGDWSDPIPFQGPQGDVGPTGPTGPSGTPFDIDAHGIFSLRSAHDDEATGFAYLSTSGDGVSSSVPVIFIKNSAAHADWSPPIPFQGPQGDEGPEGIQGPEGPAGPQGIQGYNFQVSATGTFADRATYDNQSQGFAFLSLNGDGGTHTAASIYIKASNTSGDWSTRIPFQGPKGATGPAGASVTGPAGPPGPPGAPGVGLPSGGATGEVLAKASGANFDAHWVAAGGSTAASSVTVTPTGDIASTDVQSALAELDAEKVAPADLGDAAFKNTGTTAGTVAAGDDSRLTPALPVLTMFAGGVFTANEILWAQKFANAWSLPASLTGSYATLLTAATASTVITLKKGATTIGTATFAVGGTVATFSFAAGVSFAVGDTLTIVAPATPDATAAGLYMSLKGG
jgi:hypothetical protein